MLFKPELALKILTGEKTQTRRPIKAGEKLVERDGLKTVLTAGGRIKIQVGRDYAVQFGYGKPTRFWNPETSEMMSWDAYEANRVEHGDVHMFWVFRQNGFIPMRIRMTEIRCEDVRNISYDDTLDEGFEYYEKFLSVWCAFYDQKSLPIVTDSYYSTSQIHVLMSARPEHKYQAWAYTFELMGGDS